jgi:hypothetical protein
MRVGGQRHAPAPSALGRRPGIHHTGGWLGPWASLDERRKSCPQWDSILLSLQRVTTLTALPQPSNEGR